MIKSNKIISNGVNNILFKALVWQFFDVPKQLVKIWQTFLYFNFNYFSVPTLLKTYFSPWRRNRSSYGGIFEVWKNFESFIFNSMSRIIGAILRTVYIILGIIIEIFILIVGPIVIVTWILTPFLLLIGLIFGIFLLT